jgi:hypothetical protein
MEVLSQNLEPTMRAIQSASALLESLKQINKTDDSVVSQLLVPEERRISELQIKLVSLLESMQ